MICFGVQQKARFLIQSLEGTYGGFRGMLVSSYTYLLLPYLIVGLISYPSLFPDLFSNVISNTHVLSNLSLS